MKEIKNWKEIKRRTAEDGKVQVIYELSGYYIIVSEVSWMPGGLTIEANAINRDSYLPNVYCTTSRKDDSVQEVRVQTTSWGALEISEIDKVMECYKAAQEVAHEIESAFPECFGKPEKDLMMEWYRATMVIPGTDGDAENGPCSPDFYEDMVRARNLTEAEQLANESVSDIPFDRPVCTHVERVSDQEYEEWKRQQDEYEEAEKYSELAMRWV